MHARIRGHHVSACVARVRRLLVIWVVWRGVCARGCVLVDGDRVVHLIDLAMHAPNHGEKGSSHRHRSFFFLRHTVGGGYSMICSQTTQYCPFEFWWWSLTCCRYYYSLSLEGVANYCVLQNENAPRILATILHYCNPILFMSFMASLKHENLPLKKETREFYYINCTTWISSNSFSPAPFDLEIR